MNPLKQSLNQSNYKGTLTLENLKEVLCLIFLGDKDSEYAKYIVPLQGNFFNPTHNSDISLWIGYAISNKSTSTSSTNITEGSKFRECLADISLTFIGANAEAVATTVLFWNDRSDIKNIFDDYYKGQLNHKQLSIKSSMYMQEGLNNTLCWTTQIRLTYNECITTATDILRKVKGVEGDIHGKIIIGGN